MRAFRKRLWRRGANELIVTGTGTKEVAEFIMLSTEALRRVMALETAHTSDASLDAAMVLFEPVAREHVEWAGRAI